MGGAEIQMTSLTAGVSLRTEYPDPGLEPEHPVQPQGLSPSW